MKKLKVLGLAAIAAGMFSLTSCLDGGGNTQQLSSYAIVDYSSTMRTLIYPLGYYPLYLSTVANDPTYSAGDCVLANFTVVCISIRILRRMRMLIQTAFM